MARISFATARTGKRQGRGNNLVESFEFEMGDKRRLVIPKSKDGGIIILGQPIHKVGKRGMLKLMSNNNKPYELGEVRCSHPFSQTSDKDSVKVALSDEPCVFCMLAQYEQAKQYETINEQFGEEGFSKLTKDEQKKFYEEYEKLHPSTVEKSYFRVTDEDGNSRNQTQVKMFLLVLDIMLEDDGKTIKKDDNGIPVYKPLLMAVSQARLEKFYSAVDNAIEALQLTEDMLYPYLENEGTDMEEQVNVGFVDFLVNFPKKDKKMTSGKEMSTTPLPKAASCVTAEFIAAVEEKMPEIIASAESRVNKVYTNLQVTPFDKAMEMIYRPVTENISGLDYFNEMKEKYERPTRTDADGKEILGDVDLYNKSRMDVIERAKKDENLSKLLIGTPFEGDGAVEISSTETATATATATSETESSVPKEENPLANMTDEEKKAKALKIKAEKEKKAKEAKAKAEAEAEVNLDVFDV